MKKITINGFGRIGRNFLRTVLLDKKASESLEICAINIGPADTKWVAHSFKYDTIMGTYPGNVSMNGANLLIDGTEIQIFSETNPDKLPWQQLGIDWVVDVSGKFTDKKSAQKHCDAGAGAVLISAPSPDADATIILGVNQSSYKKGTDTIISLGSCTTNALAPLLDVMHKNFTINSAYMSTIHSYTNNQVLLDGSSSDPRRARAAALNLIPTTTGATKVIGKVIPELAGKVEGCSLRVPLAAVSLVDISFIAEKNLTREAMHDALESAQKDGLAGILELAHEPLVSSDFVGNAHSVIVDGLLTGFSPHPRL